MQSEITLRQAAQQALEALGWIEPSGLTGRGGIDARSKAITALRAALAEPEQEPVARAWQEGYNQGIEDERISEANIGIFGFGAKVEPARQNPYKTTAPTPRKPLTDEEIDALMPPLPVTNVIVDGLWEEQHGPYTADQMRDYALAARALYTAPTPRKPVELTESEIAHAAASSKACVSVAHGERVAFARAVIAAYEAKQGEQT